ncbi:MAG TPA: FHA domain-containing protein, partial [Thermoanaerobaculia bacterium]|nr:FHA domain-containing protein [Thermoanaerobaculia bacterium]
MSYCLTVKNPAGRFLSFRLERDVVSLGRNDGNDVQLPYPFVSGQHLTIEVQGEKIFVKDLGSANGTRLDGAPMEPHVFEAVRPGQALELGPLVLRFEAVPEPEARLEAGGSAGLAAREQPPGPAGSLLAQPSLLWQLQTGLFAPGSIPAGEGGEGQGGDLSETFASRHGAFAPALAAPGAPSRRPRRGQNPHHSWLLRSLWLAVQVAAGLSVFVA